jgi:glycine C-acetyltransferase/8-amino-7-oxononanoate synthase
MTDWQDQLNSLEEQGLLRRLSTVTSAQGPLVEIDGRRVLLLCSNNYLGLANHPQVIEAARDATAQFGAGSGSSRLISGSMSCHWQLEEGLAAFKSSERALLFNSGYAANIGILQGLLEEGDLIFSDALNHASIIDGCRLSKARTIVYPHDDIAALDALMAQESPRRQGRWLIVTDGVFSMDGDLAPLPELVQLKKHYDALLMVDDAHGTGVLGAGGRGSGEYLGCLEQIDLHMGTLGKALGGAGAYLAGPAAAIELLINRARSFIFSTSLPPGVPAAALAALKIVDSDEGAHLRQSLAANRLRFVTALRRGGLTVAEHPSPIVPIITGDPEPTMAASDKLLAEGYFVQGIRPPTVPAGSCRLRATLMANHQPADLEMAAQAVVRAIKGAKR